MEILLSRKVSSIVSTWTEMLGFFQKENGNWLIGNCGHEIIGSLYDLIPRNELYDENDQIKIPEEINGVKVVGIADDEYLESENFVFDDYPVSFTKESFSKAIDYCEEYGWHKHPEFRQAEEKIKNIVFL
ncbi:MAG: hypothetical protein WCG95_09065 [bacterium]